MPTKPKPKSKPKQNPEKSFAFKIKVLGGLVLCVIIGLFLLRSDAGRQLLNLPLSEMQSDAAGGKFKRMKDAIRGQYIVVLKSDTQDVEKDARELSAQYQSRNKQVYNKRVLAGFSADMSEEQAMALAEDPRVAYVEEDSKIQVAASQANPPWGLDRIDQRPYPLDATYNYGATGAGVDVYVIDTGIRTTHTDFGGRARVGIDFVGDGQNGQDCHGHGTHIAGTMGGATYGVAKGVNLIAVRVMDCSGYGQASSVLGAANWITQNKTNPSVANLSLIFSGVSESVDAAIANSIASGVTYSIAAGNFGYDACNYTPSRIPTAITVGSVVYSNDTDYKMGYSNIGTCLDLFAPGNGILSAGHTDDNATRVMSGTSMAAPHVGGVAALYLEAHRSASASEVRNSIVNSATSGTIVNIDPASPNKVLHSVVSYSAPTPGQTPPTTPPSTCSGVTYTATLPAVGYNYHVANGIKGGNGQYTGTVSISGGTGPFGLVLEKKQGKNWTQVSNSTGPSYVSVIVAGDRGTYRWKVTGPAASSYQLCSQIPR